MLRQTADFLAALRAGQSVTPLGYRPMSTRTNILLSYAKWTARAAVGAPSSPIKAGAEVYPLLTEVRFSEVLDSSLGPISCKDFNDWHKRETEALCSRAEGYLPSGEQYPVGWGVKLINIYLKTTAYVGDLGRVGLRKAMHPPIDNILLAKLQHRFPEIHFNFHGIRAIATYDQYEEIIKGCKTAAKELGCCLFEVEQFFSVD